MSARPDANDPLVISRREALRRTALLLGAAVSPSLAACVDRLRPAAGGAAGPAHFTTAQFAATGAIAERIIPRTETPGALDAGVPQFIDLAYGEFMSDEERRTLVEGLAGVEAESQAAHHASFAALTPAQQDDLLRAIAAASQSEEEQTSSRSFFRQIREATVLGYFTSEEVGRNVLHYDPVPGRFDACVPLSDVGNIVWTT